MKKSIKLILLIWCISITLLGCKNNEKFIAEQLNLGQKYISELDYENAIVAFSSIIEIDEKNMEAYMGRAEAYESLAVLLKDSGDESNQEYFSLAAGDYEFLLANQGDVSFVGSHLLEIYKELGEFEKIEQFLESYKDQMQGEDIVEEVEQWQTNVTIIRNMADLCETEDYEAVFEIMRSEDYQHLQKLTEDMGVPMLVEVGEKKMGLYPIVTENYGNCMVYYGEYQDDTRHGYGLWLGYQDGANYRAEGQWANDMPNGEQKIAEWYSGLDETVVTRRVEGPVTNGLWNGAVNWIFDRVDSVDVFPVNIANGKWVELRISEDGRHVVCESIDGQGILSVADDDMGDILGIAGFTE